MLAALMATGLMSSVAPGASAIQDEALQIIEIPGSGFTVGLPVEWRVWPAEGVAHPMGITATDVGTRQHCSFSLLEGVASAERAAHQTVELVEAQPQQEIVERTFLDLPAGNAVRVAYRLKDAPDDPRFVLNEYYLTVPDGVVSAFCSGDEPPADRWLSVIETIAPLAAAPPLAAPFDPRVEVAAHGFAVDFPSEWLVRSWPGLGPVLEGSIVLRAVTLAHEDGSGGYECLMEDATALPSLADVASLADWRDVLGSTARAPEQRTSEPVVTQIDLPSGPIVRADWERWSGMPATAWIFTDGDRHAALLCRSVSPPDDRWRSVAESFEFLPALGIGSTTPAPAQDDGAPAAADSSPILEALSLLPPGIDAFEFTDWSAIKAAHDGSDVTSASPLTERQRLMLEIARHEATTFPLGLDRLGTWSERWGWDTTDLEWQASCCNAFDFSILRFREDWDAGPFMARLEADGYERRDEAHATSFTLEDGTDAPDRDFLERAIGMEGSTGGAPTPRASVAIAPDGHTVVLVRGPDAHEILKLAAQADPVATAESPFGRVAAALGRPLAARVWNGEHGCWSTGAERDASAGNARLVEAVGELHPYEAFGTSYERPGAGESAVGRYVFAYERAPDAEADLPGRRRLIDEGDSIRYGAPYRERAFTLVDAVTDGRQVVLDVAPVDDSPQTLFDTVIAHDMVFATCG